MKQNYLHSRLTLIIAYFESPVKLALSFVLLGVTAAVMNAQNLRVQEDASKIAKLSYDENINDAASKITGSAQITNSDVRRVLALNGNFTVGVGGDYATLTAAVADFNASPITGAVTFTLLDSTYPSETFPIVINANAGSSMTNTLTIKPSPGVNTTISGSAAVLIKINGADYVTIDGSNDGTDSDNLTLNNVNPTAAFAPAIVWVASTATDGADYVTLKNIKFLGYTPTITVAGLLVSGPTLGSAGTIPNNYLRAESNTFNRAQNAVFAIGLATAPDLGAVITENTIGSSEPLEMMGFRGIAVQNASNFVISKNLITGVTTASTATPAGILVDAAVNNGVITQNNVSGISNTNASGYGAVGIHSDVFEGNSNILISNNFVSDVTGLGYAGLGGLADNGNGIVIGDAGTNIRLYHNTVVLNTNQANAGRPSALNILSTVTAAGSLDIRNNIFANTQTTTGARYSIYYGGTNNAIFTNIDDNSYYSTGPNLAFHGTTPRLDLAALQTAFGGNANSKNVAPSFVSATDFHLTTTGNTELNNSGAPLAEVTVDIDDEGRSTTTPDIGADEFTGVLATSDVTRNSVKVYPNPVVDFVTISHSNKIDMVEIYSVTGQRISAKNLNTTSGTMDMRNLSPGMYMIKLKVGNEVQTVKVIKK